MKPSSIFVLTAAVAFFVAAICAMGEQRPFPLAWAYLMLGFANLGFSLLD